MNNTNGNPVYNNLVFKTCNHSAQGICNDCRVARVTLTSSSGTNFLKAEGYMRVSPAIIKTLIHLIDPEQNSLSDIDKLLTELKKELE